MNLKVLVALAGALLIGGNAAGDNATVEEVENAVRTLNELFVKRDADGIRRLMTAEHLAITPYYGGPQNITEQLEHLADHRLTEYAMGKVKVTLLAKDVALVSYPLTLKGTYKGETVSGKYYVGAVWVRRNTKWLEAFYQESPVENAQKGGRFRRVRYGEIFVVDGSSNQLEARVYNTTGLNDCPAGKWKALDPEGIKKELKALAVILNGPRYWIMDKAGLQDKPGPVVSFGGLEMRQIATLKVPAGDLLGGRPRRTPYSEQVVMRNTEYTYAAGNKVYELVSPDGTAYVMQSYSHEVDDTLTEESLSSLGNRLKLPRNWKYRLRKLDADWVVRSTEGKAHVIQDEFQNTYQRVDPVTPARQDAESIKKLLLKVERDWATALEKRDGKAIAALLANDFISVEPDGSLLNKEQYLEARVKDQELESSTLEQMQVRVYGPTATVTGLQTNQRKRKGEKVTERYRYVDVFILQDGAWKCISTQVTPLPAKK